MKKTALIFVLSTFTIPFSFVSLVSADVAPTTKCVTTSTKATHAGYLARMEKDIAPYQKTVGAEDAIQKYRDSMDVAWSAMNEPYCGYGTYGTKSAIKSYGKSVERARTAFVTAVKGLSKTTTSVTHPVVVPTDQPKSENILVKSTVSYKTIVIPPGLAIGMRSSDVLQLQKKLAGYFKIVDEASISTGYFGPKTEGLVKKYQIQEKIITSESSPGAGRVGPKTAAALNRG